MEVKSFMYKGRRVTVESCVDETNVRFYSLTAFHRIFGPDGFTKKKMPAHQAAVGSNIVIFRPLGDFNVPPSKGLGSRSIFITKLGLKLILKNLRHKERFTFIDFARKVLNSFNDPWTNFNHELSLAKVEIDGAPIYMARISGADIQNFYLALRLNIIFQYIKLHKAVLKYVSAGNSKYYDHFEVSRVSIKRSLFSRSLSTVLRIEPCELESTVGVLDIMADLNLRPNSLFINEIGIQELILKSQSVFLDQSLKAEVLFIQSERYKQLQLMKKVIGIQKLIYKDQLEGIKKLREANTSARRFLSHPPIKENIQIYLVAYIAKVFDPSIFNEPAIYICRAQKRYIDIIETKRQQFLRSFALNRNILANTHEHPISWYFGERFYSRPCGSAVTSWQDIRNSDMNFFYGLKSINNIYVGFTLLTRTALEEKFLLDLENEERRRDLLRRGIGTRSDLFEKCYTDVSSFEERMRQVIDTAFDRLYAQFDPQIRPVELHEAHVYYSREDVRRACDSFDVTSGSGLPSLPPM